MDKNAYQLVSSAGLFVDSAWVDAPSAALNGIVSRLRADGEGGTHRPWARTAEAPVSGSGGDDFVSPLPIGFGYGGAADRDEIESDQRRGGTRADGTTIQSRGDVGNATAYAGQRDPIAVYRTEILRRLLEPIHPAAWGGCRVLWPLWADEMVHRTYVTIHLTALRMAQLRREPDPRLRFALDYGVAANLAAAMGELAIVRDDQRLSCSAVLRGIARNMVELFGPVAGNVGITTWIEPLQLAAFKRRALGLVVADLIAAALLEGADAQAGGEIDVRLVAVSRGCARLTVSGGGIKAAPVSQSCQPIGQDLASLLEAEITYRSQGRAQIDFRV